MKSPLLSPILSGFRLKASNTNTDIDEALLRSKLSNKQGPFHQNTHGRVPMFSASGDSESTPKELPNGNLCLPCELWRGIAVKLVLPVHRPQVTRIYGGSDPHLRMETNRPAKG